MTALVSVARVPDAASSCVSTGASAWTSDLLPTNGLIILHGIGPTVLGAPREGPYLVDAAGRRTRLNVVEAFHVRSGLERAQVLLRPARPLRPNTRYELRFRTGVNYGWLDPPAWHTGPRVDGGRPAWDCPPSIDAVQTGCFNGCSASVRVALPLADPADAVFLRVRLEGGGRVEEWLEQVQGNQIRLESGYCSPVKLEIGARYSLQLTALDAAGNATVAPGLPLLCRIPDPAPADESRVTVELPSGATMETPPRIAYPPIALRAALAATVEAALSTREDGSVREVRITRSVPILDAAVVAAASSWCLSTPGDRAPIPVVVSFQILRHPYTPDWSP